MSQVHGSLNMLATGTTSLAELEPDLLPGPFGLHGAASIRQRTEPSRQRTESEPDSHAYQGGVEDRTASSATTRRSLRGPRSPATASARARGSTRAPSIARRASGAFSCSASDTNDLAFLMAKIAREVRQSKEATESERQASGEASV
ncbi:unnamed protein product [Prorocentrum cordatum]|uniref:Uncharacterized protein n=1 Tax=Prorocentrum cordatum TaxID=2364126 RepID=A0ABN9UJ06_9DINO|nr:unnamed protein product [Polarella glacialis]